MKKIPTVDDSYMDLKELDRLVTQELDVFQLQSRKTGQIKKPRKRKPYRSDNVIFQEAWQKNNPPYKNSPPPEEPDFIDDTGDFDNTQREILEPIDNEQTEQPLKTALFSEEELDFIERSTAWLESRKNKDLIINQIWEQLTESVPENFYSVESGARSEAENFNIEAPNSEENPEADSPESSS